MMNQFNSTLDPWIQFQQNVGVQFDEMVTRAFDVLDSYVQNPRKSIVDFLKLSHVTLNDGVDAPEKYAENLRQLFDWIFLQELVAIRSTFDWFINQIHLSIESLLILGYQFNVVPIVEPQLFRASPSSSKSNYSARAQFKRKFQIQFYALMHRAAKHSENYFAIPMAVRWAWAKKISDESRMGFHALQNALSWELGTQFLKQLYGGSLLSGMVEEYNKKREEAEWWTQYARILLNPVPESNSGWNSDDDLEDREPRTNEELDAELEKTKKYWEK